MNPELIVLSSQEKMNYGYDVLLVYHKDNFDIKDRVEALEDLIVGLSYSSSLIGSNPLGYSYVETLYFTFEMYDTSSVLVQQEQNRIVITPKNDSCFSVVYEIDETNADYNQESCYQITYKTRNHQCNKAMLNSAFNISDWIPIDKSTYVSKYGVATYNPPSEKRRKMAAIHKMIVVKDEKDDTIKITITMDEIDFKTFKDLKKQNKKSSTQPANNAD
jgi:hypothetical protein